MKSRKLAAVKGTRINQILSSSPEKRGERAIFSRPNALKSEL
jgi:hypothetical protein